MEDLRFRVKAIENWMTKYYCPPFYPTPPKPERKTFKEQDYEAWVKDNYAGNTADIDHRAAMRVREQVRAVWQEWYEGRRDDRTAIGEIRALVKEETS